MRRQLVLSVAVLAGFCAASSFGAMSFTNPLTSEAGLVPVLAEADTLTADREITYSPAGAQIGMALLGNDGRNHIHSIDDDYNTVDFIAEVTVDFSVGGRLFMGIGGGEIGAYGTPDWDITDSGWLELGQYGLSNTFTYNLGNGGPNGPVGAGVSVSGPQVRVQMAYEAATGMLSYVIDDAYTGGPVVAEYAIPGIDMSAFFTDGEVARVFVGGGSGVILRDLEVTVIPEPASLALLTLGALVVVRRQKN